ncbi:tRNA-specific 2-thiouridylase [Thermovibrio guaymasensis]|uniref:tRNA-specific 2-thiouridylase MnmA n=1 Tax=Thermovibrio guaymasensis TaxID=240167 RepID=A0A420W7B5_9BACT|nr:tRNA 2-thiouridine(34) synthase MnmA [Thermovibrio guaymasensis]RKQ63155.1 tRNA-specific 2-thiouridylase [Thermovibrio guaymasensis]
MGKRVLLGFSGGVDSFYSAYLLREKSFDVHLIYFKLLKTANPERVRKSAELLKLPLTVIDLSDEFRKAVIDYFIRYYKLGLTPNPCAVCNREIKLKYLYRLMKELSFDFIATGHYARVVYVPEFRRNLISRGVDRRKEQSYFLSLVEREVFDSLLLPLGDFTKEEVVKRAKELGFEYRGESQDICFIPGEYTEFLKRFIKPRPGYFRLRDGTVLGRHKGLFYYTVGQRRGLGIPYKHSLYVLELLPEENAVVVGSKEEILKDEILVWKLNWHVKPEELVGREIEVQIRYRAKPVKVRELKYLNSDFYCVKLAAKVEAPAPGQVCAFYNGDLLIGGGEITREGAGRWKEA